MIPGVVASAVVPFGPTLVSSATIKGWYDASQESAADGTAMSTITDRSSFAKNLTQATSGSRPTIQTDSDGRRYYDFDGTDDNVKAATASDWQFLNDTAHAVFAVVELDAHPVDGRSTIVDTGGLSTSNTGFWLAFDNRGPANGGPDGLHLRSTRSAGGSTDNYLIVTDFDTAPLNERMVVAATSAGSGGSARLRVNGNRGKLVTDSSVSTGGTTPLGALCVGARSSGTALPMNGRVHEVVLFSGTISTADRDRLLVYLADKWRVPVWADQGSSITVQAGTTYDAFPAMERADNGDLVVIARRGSSHTSTFGDLVKWTSSDLGATWSSSSVIFDGATENCDLRDPGLVKLAGGTLLLTLSIRGVGGSGTSVVDGCRWATSTDHGATWSALSTLNDAFAGFSRCSTRPCLRANGDILWPIYGNDIGDANNTRWVKVYKSTDDGGSFTYLSDIGAIGDATGWGESTIVENAAGTLIALVRNNTTEDLYRCASTDDGATWSALTSVIPDGNSSPMACYTAKGVLVTSQRVSSASDSGYLYTSIDDGVTWVRGELMANAVYEYGSPVVAGNQVIVAFAREQSASDCDVLAVAWAEF